MAADVKKIGVIGCGNISGAYLKALAKFRNVQVAACADLLVERAKAQAEKFSIPTACGVDELLARDDIDIVLNLTIPKAHADVAVAALLAGKNVHNEKPLAVNKAQAKGILQDAGKTGLRVGCAPDTFLGGGYQTCRKLIDDGAIGEPVGAVAFFTCRGHESWHPDPEFYYKPGGGPMLDMGPYYVTALVSLLGPIRRVTGSARVSFPRREIGSEPRKGRIIDVEVPTHVAGVLDFESGAVAQVMTSFDVCGANLPRIEVFGSEGTLSCPDPNIFGGQVRLLKRGTREWTDVPLTHGYTENFRGIGPADMAAALSSGREHRCNGRLAYHVLDIMESIHDASREGTHIELESTTERPAPLPTGLAEGELD